MFANEQGKLNWYCLDFWGDTLELDILSIKARYTDGIRWRPQAETFLRQLQASHLDVVLITNAHPLTLQMKAERLPIAQWFDKIISSHDYGVPKETPAFWNALMGERPFNPGRTLFMDDSEHVLDSARSTCKIALKLLTTCTWASSPSLGFRSHRGGPSSAWRSCRRQH